MLINSRSILKAWDFILAKQKVGNEMCNLFQPVLDGVSSSRLLKKKVFSGSLTVNEAYLSAKTAMNNL